MLVPGKRQLDLLLALATHCLSACKPGCGGGLADGQEWLGDPSWGQAMLGKPGSEVMAAWPCACIHSPGAGVGMHLSVPLDQGGRLILPVLLAIHR